MSAAALIAEARAAGVFLSRTSEDRIAWACEAEPPPDLLARIAAQKSAVLVALRAAEWFGPDSALEWAPTRTPADDGEPWRHHYEERAAIREHDGGLSRADAEAGALADCVARWRVLNPLPASDDRACVHCGEARPDTPVLAPGGHAWLHRECPGANERGAA